MVAPELLDRLEPLHADAFGWALHCCHGDHDAAEEALQTAYCRVADARAQFGGRAELKTWWFGVVRLVALEQRRRAFWRMEKLRAWFAQGGSLAEEPAAEVGEARAIGARLAALPPRQREVLHLVFYQEFSVAEAAAAMGVSVGSARQHYDRAKQRLRRELTTSHEPD